VDWITLLVEAAGGVIFVIWMILPAREFKEIYRRIMARDAAERAGGELEHAGDPAGRDHG
jgi:hypothetical protein